MFDFIFYPFFLRAIAAALLLSISCGIIGTYIVSKRIVFISGGITHSSFGGIGMGYYFGFSPILGASIFAVISAYAIELISKNSQMRTDSLIGILWSFGMALGILFVFLTPGYAPNLMSYLFGNILTISNFYIYMMILLTAAIILFFYIFYHNILYIAFDEEYSKTQKIPVNIINYILLTLISLTIVISIKIVGVILIISLLTIPQSIASIFTNDFKKIIFLSILFGIISCMSGLIISYFLKIPSGSSIIISLVILFIFLKIITIIKANSLLSKKLKKH